uniref:AAA+ ATPase domain-containing protein n=1 Tax=viral metagenome TaxID=1070528 RepID=A0A6C0JAY1_9ZZZZ
MLFNYNDIFETIKTSLLFQFHTGNVIFDTLINGLIICITSYIMSLTINIKNMNFRNLFKFITNFNCNMIRIIGIKYEGRFDKCDYSNTFRAILHQIKSLNYIDAQIYTLNEIQFMGYGDKELVQKTNLIVDQNSYFKLTKDIRVLILINNEKIHNKTQEFNNIKSFEMQVFSYVLTLNELQQQIDKWLQIYLNLNSPNKYLRYFMYDDISITDNVRYDPHKKYSEFKFESGKSFNNIFFPQKKDLIDRLDFFKNNKIWYKTRGISYTLGMLFYGMPGCGKTSTIKAIANHTNRHIVSVSLNKIKSFKELLEIFYENKINNMIIPLDKRLYVIEDIDCSDMKKIIRDRSLDNDDSDKDSDKDSGAELNSEDSEYQPKKKPKEKEEQKLSLADILNILDGLMEMDGRMLVITTNYPEYIDSALTRPGRIDIKINFQKCTSQSLISLYKCFFSDKKKIVWDKLFDKLPNDRWTPAEATQIFFDNSNNPSRGLTQLITDFP